MSTSAKWSAMWVALAATAVYLNALPNGYTYDDVPIILENPTMSPDAPWWQPWTRPYWPGTNQDDDIDVLYRPLTIQTYSLERRLFGEWSLPPHLLNVILHAGVSVGVFWLAGRLRCRPRTARWIGLIFAVHPIHVEVVANIVGRAELLSTLGMVLALWMTDRWADGRSSPASEPRTLVRADHPPTLYLLGMVLAAAVAITSKESGVFVILLVPAWFIWRCRRKSYDVGDSSSGPPTGALRETPTRAETGHLLRSLVVLTLPLLVLFVAYLAVRYQVCGARLTTGGQRVGPGNPLRDAEAVARMLTPVSLLGRYLLLMCWPARLLCDYSADVILLTKSVAQGYFLVGLTFIGTLAAGAGASLRRNRTVLLVAIGFVCTYVVASNTLLLIDVIFAERLFYGPSVWVCLAFGLAIDRALPQNRLGDGRNTVPIFLCGLALVMVFSVVTFRRNPSWQNNETLFRADLAKMAKGRRSAHLCSSVARLDTRKGRYAEAEKLLREAIRIHPDYPEYFRRLAEVHLATGRSDLAVAALEQAHLLERRNTETSVLLRRARQEAAGVDVQGELEQIRAQVRADPSNVELLQRWSALARLVDPQEALQAHRRWVKLAPEDLTALRELAFALAFAKQQDEAVRTMRELLQRRPDDWEAHTNLALLLMDRTDADRYDPAAAIRHAQRAVELNPTHWQVRVNLAEVTAHCGDPEQAARLFTQLASQCTEGSDERRLYLDRAKYLRDR